MKSGDGCKWKADEAAFSVSRTFPEYLVVKLPVFETPRNTYPFVGVS